MLWRIWNEKLHRTSSDQGPSRLIWSRPDIVGLHSTPYIYDKFPRKRLGTLRRAKIGAKGGVQGVVSVGFCIQEHFGRAGPEARQRQGKR